MVPMTDSQDEEFFLQKLDSRADFLSSSTVSAGSGTTLPVSSWTATETIPKDHHDVPSALLGQFPAYLVAILAVVSCVMTSTFLYFLCRCLTRRKKREDRLASLTPQKKLDPRLAGVRASQPVEFVVPSTTAVTLTSGEPVTTEDSVSETDCYSSSGGLPMALERARRKRAAFQINPDDLQHGLYVGVTAASGSERGGIFLGDLGSVGFSLRYNLQRGRLTVRIIGAKDLPCHFLKTTANPCAKLTLLPDKTPKYATRVLKNTSSPAFDESFVFCVRRDELQDKRLKITVWDYDRFSRRCLIGQVIYDIRDSGLTDNLTVEASTGEIWANLKQESSAPLSEKGEMLLSLCYDPDSATLTLTVLKVRGIDMRQDKTGKDTYMYAKVTLYVRRKLVRTKKTPSRKKAPDAEFSSPFSIHVPQAALRDVDLTVSLCEKWPLGGKKVLGRTQAGTNCLCDQGLQHWQDMLASPKSTCAQWHVLCG